MKKFSVLLTLLYFIAAPLSSSSQGTTHTILTGNFYFNPSTLTNVQVGDVIRWDWVEGSHTTTSVTIPAGATSWDAPLSSSSTFYEYTVTTPGQYNYKCTPHSSIQTGSFMVVSANTLSVSPSNRDVTHTSGSTTFDVMSNTNWTATSNASWCSVTPSGSGNGTISATYVQNPNTTSRVAEITVTVTGLTPEVVTVTQDASPATLMVSPSNHDVTYTNGTANFTITSNSNWTANSNAGWCTVTSGGSGNGTLIATFAENTDITARVANITVNVSGLSPEVVTVTQDGTPLTLMVTPPNRDVTYTDGSTTFDVTSNTDWLASSDASWCSVSPGGSGNGTITATYTENPDSFSRTANITVTIDGLTPEMVSVTQDGLTVGVGEIEENTDLKVYPNPTDGLFTIYFGNSSSGKDADVSVLDASGKVIIQQKFSDAMSNFNFDLTDYPRGLYFVKVNDGNTISTRKIIKK